MDQPIEQKHSGVGIASFIISVLVGIAMAALFVGAAILHARGRDGVYPGQALVGIIAILLLFADTAAFGLGLASVFAKERKKIFGILGLTFSALTLLGTVGLIVLGLKISGKM